MAHATKYSIPFLNREQINCEVQLQLDGYAGGVTILKGAENPFVLSRQSQDSQIPYGILGTESVIEFFTGGLVELSDFYSEVFTDWRVQFYYNGTLRFTHFIQIDNSSELITDTDHVISLNGNDALGQLQNLYLLNDDGTPIYENWKLTELLDYIFGFLPDLDINAYLNIFENSTQDRDDDGTLTFLPQTVIDTKYYINSDDQTTLSLYEILNNILTDFRSALFQERGVWNIIRWGDLRIFPAGAIPGTKYEGFLGTATEIFYPSEITVGRGLQVRPINENQQGKPLRAFQYSKETFNYNQLVFVRQSTLQIDDAATPYATNTIGDFRYDDYLLATYFPNWKQINDDASYLEIVTDTTTNTETDRYIVTPCCTVTQSGVQFNPIPVTMNDSFDISLSWRTDVDTNATLNFYLRVTLITETHYYGLINIPTAGLPNVRWGSPGLIVNYPTDNSTGFLFQDVPNAASIDTTEWMSFSLASFVEQGGHLPLLPRDGMLLIEVCGTNGSVSTNTQGTYWKDISVPFVQNINNSTQIVGQYHLREQDREIRNNEQYEVTHDDSPRNTILGTLFTDALTTFEADIGDVYFTKTSLWHRQGFDEARRLGDLNTFIDLFNQRIVRQIVEGDFFGLTDVSMLSIVNFPFASTKKFVMGIAQFNFMSCIWNSILYELFYEDEPDSIIELTTILEADADVTTHSSTGTAQAIDFPTVNTNTDFTPDGSFINWTYNGSTADVNLTVNINGIWNGAASATLNLNVNGTPVGSYLVGTGGAFHFFSANIQETVTLNTSDVIDVILNWSGSIPYTLQILNGSYLKATTEQDVEVGQYTFNYIYQTN